MALPKSEDTTNQQEAYIKKEKVKVLVFTAAAGHTQGDYHIIGESFGGIVAATVLTSETASLIVEPYQELEAIQASVTFAVGDKVYWTGTAWSKTATSNTLIGVCTVASDANDVFRWVNYGIMGQEANV